jgi:hypothetical protein
VNQVAGLLPSITPASISSPETKICRHQERTEHLQLFEDYFQTVPPGLMKPSASADKNPARVRYGFDDFIEKAHRRLA